tara:strand:+ start:71 stop:676 length:606 start_codon:yes stop_codon:yes gene_type:complete
MFTGLVQYLGIVESIVETEGSFLLNIEAPRVFFPAQSGESIAVDGCCLTLVDSKNSTRVLSFEVIPQTLEMTTLGSLKAGSEVNLERAVTLETLLGGHLVTGHIDFIGEVERISDAQGDYRILIYIKDDSKMLYLAPQGSVTVCGVSLTIANVFENRFEIALIPETLSRTNLKNLLAGDHVNIEFDVIAKHVERLVNAKQH